MANPTRIEGDVHVAGTLTALVNTPSALSVTNAKVAAAAAIAATKMEHQYKKNYGEESATGVGALVRPIHVVYGATGTLVDFSVSSVVAATGSGSVEVDLLKNGTTVLTTKAILTTTETSYETVKAVIGTTALVAGDVLEMSIGTPTATAPKGISVDLTLRETPI